MAFGHGNRINRNALVATATTCFILVVAGAILSLVGMLDALLAADLYIFEALSDMHAAVFGMGLAIIAMIGFSAALTATRRDQLVAKTRLPSGYAPNINMQLDAERIQTMLHVLQYPVRIDGVFGPETAKVVREFQQDQDMLMDGVVGPLTLEALQSRLKRKAVPTGSAKFFIAGTRLRPRRRRCCR